MRLAKKLELPEERPLERDNHGTIILFFIFGYNVTYKWHSYGSRVAGNVVDNQEIRQTCFWDIVLQKKSSEFFDS